MLLSACSKSDDQQQALIPMPNQLVYNSGTFAFNDKTVLVLEDDQLKDGIAVFNNKIERFSGKQLELKSKQGKGQSIIIRLNASLEDEAYELKIGTKNVVLEAATSAGVFYGLQTFLQMCPKDIHAVNQNKAFSFNISTAHVTDAPQFGWRGMMLDVSRHFFTKEEVKELIDYLAYHKLNVFHWHLVDDQGWRIEIKKYPKLTEVGAWRVDREHLPWDSRPAMKEGEKATYGGYYTQEDIKEVVAYAKERFITVVPEIEMPGHTTSSLAAYPEYSCTGGPFNVVPGGLWPITDIYCAGKDETFAFIEDVLSEVMELFPSRYIHIGGDEANKAEWEKCKRCQARIKSEGLKNEHELRGH
jgi:hexosaminidase